MTENEPLNRETENEPLTRQGVADLVNRSKVQVDRWVNEYGYLQPLNPGCRPLLFSPEAALNALKSAEDSGKARSSRTMKAVCKRRWNVPRPKGLLTKQELATELSVSISAIDGYRKRRLLKRAKEWHGRPLFKLEDGQKAKDKSERGRKRKASHNLAIARSKQCGAEGDIPLREIFADLPGEPGEIGVDGQSQKLRRIEYIVRLLGAAGKNRGHARRDRLPEIKAKYLEITTGLPEEMRPGDITICDAAAKYKRDYNTILRRLAKHAPADCVRTVKRRWAGGWHDTRVAIEAAIEAALRGETWTPPTARNEGEPLPIVEEPAAKESEPPKPAKPVSAKADPLPDDNSAYVAASKLLKDKRDRFATYRKFETWLKNTPETEVRRRRPRKNRLELHAGDWARYWAAVEKAEFDALDR